ARIGGIVHPVWAEASSFNFYPDLLFEVSLADNILIPYLKYTGYTKLNTLQEIVAENPFMFEKLYIAPSNFRNYIEGGIRGSLSKSVPYNVSLSFSDVRNMIFFVNEGMKTDSVFNKFTVIYDNVQIVQPHLELGLLQGKRFDVNLYGDYYKYNLERIKEAWHKPGYSIGFNFRYNISDKLITRTDIFYIGKRYAPNYTKKNEVVALKDIIDVNLAFEYRYTSILSAFLKFNNIPALKYNLWQYYPAYRFNVLAGVTYSF
ncbi:MAG: hypothetical protein SNJ71_03500, partial [Bacteroidales bacterium]